ncbi:uncharacterized protein LOC133905730 [Phragmites australis]|uniref:uncharacterized protein LOC133905730 n=1 Tax=Phragmites australis TaxID=29695 RepID=UPI002D79A388|nr:uncharacterized protein LOC133905730 [Phragmites australis]
MPTSPLKLPSPGGRLGRLLDSLRQPARAGPLPVQTGFPTSLADLVVKNHVRLKNPRRRHRPSAVPSSPAPPVTAAELVPQQRRELSVVQDAAIRPKVAAFSIRPELLAVGGTVALALLLIWSKMLVAAATLASVALFWIESVRSSASRQGPETKEELDLGGRGRGSPIREEDSAADTPRLSCADSDQGSEVSSLGGADTIDLAGGDDSISSKRKEKRRSLRKLIAKKLHNGKRSKDKDSPASRHGGERKHPDAGEVGVNAGPVKTETLATPAEQTSPPEAITDEKCRRWGALPLSAFIPIILVGLIAGKLPAVALAVLCAVFFSSVERVPS